MESNPPSDNEKKINCKCGHCGGQFLVSSDMLNSKLLCPHCKEEVKEPIDMDSADSAQPAKTQLPPPKKEKFTPTRRPAPAAPQEKLRYEERPHSFVAAEPEPEFDKTRLKRYVKEDKGSMTSFFLVLGALGMLTIAGVFYYKTIDLPDITDTNITAESLLVDNESKNTSSYQETSFSVPVDLMERDDHPAPSDDPILEATREQVFQKGDLEKALTTIKQFSAAKTVEELMQYVYAPQETLEPMKKWFERAGNADQESPKPVHILNARLIGKIMIANITFDDNSIRTANLLYDESRETWLLDWFSWEQYEEMTYDEIIAKRPTNPVVVRVHMGMAANYEKPFLSSPEEGNYKGAAYINVDLRYDDSHSLRGYINRHDELSAQITKELMIGSLPVTIAISFPEAQSGAKPDQVIITRLIRIGWLGDAAYKANEQYIKSMSPSQD